MLDPTLIAELTNIECLKKSFSAVIIARAPRFWLGFNHSFYHMKATITSKISSIFN